MISKDQSAIRRRGCAALDARLCFARCPPFMPEDLSEDDAVRLERVSARLDRTLNRNVANAQHYPGHCAACSAKANGSVHNVVSTTSCRRRGTAASDGRECGALGGP